jgi:hypothetical protein
VDHDDPGIGHFPDIGQQLTWRLSWKHTPVLVDDRRGNCEWDLAEIGRAEAGQIAAELAQSHWPAGAARLPWVLSAYPGDLWQMPRGTRNCGVSCLPC